MRNSLAIILLLSCVTIAAAQSRYGRPQQERPDPSLLPAPMVTSFESRPLYRPGDENISDPVVITQPEPTPLKDFRPARVVLWCIVGLDGKAHMIKVAKRDTMETEMKAVDNVRKWTFKPAHDTKSKADVDMLITVDVVWQ